MAGTSNIATSFDVNSDVKKLITLLTAAERDTAFDRYYLKNSIKGMRTTMVLSALLFLGFGFIVDTLPIQWFIRLCLIIPAILGALVISYTPVFTRYSQSILALAVFACHGGLILMIYFTPSHASRDVYSTGLSLVFFGASAVRLRAMGNIVVSFLSICFYFIVFKDSAELLIHIPLLVSASLLTLISSGYAEHAMRKTFRTLNLLNEQKQKLEYADNLKGKLISIISHDLRGPMNNILSLMHINDSGVLGKSEFDSLLRSIQVNAQRTKDLLEDLLIWSVHKITGRQNMVKVNFQTLLEELVGTLQADAIAKGNILSNGVQSWETHSDPGLITIVIRNVIKNAIKFTSNGTIVITGELLNDFLRISVRDSGVGIANANMRKLLSWNDRFTSPGTASEKGTGLGLLICNDFLQSMGGKLTIESIEGSGTTVHLFIPTRVGVSICEEKSLLKAS